MAGVRAAAPRDLYAAHAFLPWIAAAAVPLQGLFVAEDAEGVCGVGALSTLQTDAGLRADIVVHPGARRRGLGSALLQRLADVARAWGASRLRTWRPTDDAPAQAFLAHHGAEPTSRLLTFEAMPDLAAFRRRLGARTVAAMAAVRPLAESDLPALAALYAEFLGDTVPVALQRLRAMLADPLTSALSVGYERRGALRAFIVFQPGEQGVPRLDFWYADPSVRGVSSLSLIVAAIDRIQAVGAGPIRCQCRDDSLTTLRLAEEMGVQPLRIETSYALAL